MEQNSNMGTEKISKLMLRLSLPTIIAQVINVLYNIVDRMYVGHIPEVGANALTGLGVSAPLILIVSAFSMFVGGGGAPLAAIALGKNDKEEAEKILGTGTVILIILSIALTIGVFIFKEPLLYLFGASDVTFPYANEYTTIYLLGTLFVQFALGLNLFITCQGKTKIAMFSVLIGAITNIILDPILIYGFNMGVRGAAIATVFSQALSAAFVVAFLVSNKSIIRIRFKYLKLNAQYAIKTLSLGVSSFTMQVTESAILIVFNNGLLKYGGDIYVGTMTIMQSVMQLLTIPIQGLIQGTQPIVSYNYGAGKYDRLKETMKLSLKITVGATAGYYVLVFFFPHLFARIFTSEADLLNLVAKILPIFMGGMWLFGVQMTSQMFFVGTGQAGKSLFIALLRKVILLIPMAIILPNFFGVMGVFYSEPIADLISASTSGFLLFYSLKKLKNLS
ncbi:MATE family efflux transporter [Anaerocolumna aminovalerica]|uniref:Multidrug export protein MepA n=2 Tax=Anaerocolumna aminovalerica TaxID=1527 RepID=A0A1I5DZL8_9FIRM|nr:MATE family efflux transporter [Anaerocolumna aminovalerica]MDU6263462.1 MATE family efflux transporter [Anaerocolumna aminovalerica]SFO04646.1 putative efflux protein, MATE family [Anaerocolumna aminovalerica]